MYSLFLYEEQPYSNNLSEQELKTFLTQIGFSSNKTDHLSIGSKFLFHINFLGCSPTLYQDTSHKISIHFYQKCTYLGGESIHTIQCPSCKNKLNNVQEIFNRPKKVKCVKCQTLLNPDQINWRRSAARSQKFIEIHGIFPKEALPNDEFVQNLNNFRQSHWNYFYSKSIT